MLQQHCGKLRQDCRIWVSTDCLFPTKRTLGVYGLIFSCYFGSAHPQNYQAYPKIYLKLNKCSTPTPPPPPKKKKKTTAKNIFILHIDQNNPKIIQFGGVPQTNIHRDLKLSYPKNIHFCENPIQYQTSKC